jgi:hypothetical protein
MGGEEESYPEGSAEQAAPKPPLSLQREDPRYCLPHLVCCGSTRTTRTRRRSACSGRCWWGCSSCSPSSPTTQSPPSTSRTACPAPSPAPISPPAATPPPSPASRSPAPATLSTTEKWWSGGGQSISSDSSTWR